MTASSILISGCSSGIGYACAQGLAARGWRVFASARRAEDVVRLRQVFPDALQLDVDDSDSIQRAVTAVLAATGGTLDALFNNAGYGQLGAAEDVPRHLLRAQFETNLFGAWELTQAVLPAMRQRGQGRIVFNSSVLGFAPMRWRAAYSASKHAMEGMADTLRLELHGSGVAVSLIEPGPITSRFLANEYPHLKAVIEAGSSVHQADYVRQLARVTQQGKSTRFTLPPEAVCDALLRVLDAKHPAARYRVTVPTHLCWWLKRVLPQRVFDMLLRKLGG